jgi:imidazolonepropionase-like amidohydrolase
VRLALITLTSVAFLSTCGQAQSLQDRQLIKDVRVFDGEGIVEHRSVLIANGKIAKIGDASASPPNSICSTPETG